MKRTMTIVGLVCATLATAAPVAAQELEAGFWRSVREPGYARAMHLTQQGLYLWDMWRQAGGEGMSGDNPFERNAILEGAMERFGLAHRLVPTDETFLFLFARTTSLWARPEPTGEARMDDEALALYAALRELDPEFQAANVAFDVAIIHTRAHRFSDAATEYQYAIARALEPDSVHWSNLAEVTMLAGDVEEAVRLYERAIVLADQGEGAGKLLAKWGLAVALDRLGEHREALSVAEQAVLEDDLNPLHREGVFYEPAYEIHYYEGLGHAAQARIAESGQARQRALARSRESFRRFLAEGGTESPWAALAERHAQEPPTGRTPR